MIIPLCKLEYKRNQNIRGKRKLHNDAVTLSLLCEDYIHIMIYYVGLLSHFSTSNKKNSQQLTFNIRMGKIEDSFEVE